jgi:hypothetical protein
MTHSRDAFPDERARRMSGMKPRHVCEQGHDAQACALLMLEMFSNQWQLGNTWHMSVYRRGNGNNNNNGQNGQGGRG